MDSVRIAMCCLFVASLFVGQLACQPTPEPVRGQGQSLRQLTEVYFSFPAKGAFTADTFYDFPYPHNARLDADGTPALKAFPAPKRKETCSIPSSGDPLVGNLLKNIDPDEYVSDIVKVTDEQTKGFSINPTIAFRFTRGLDPKTLPPTSASFSETSPVFLVDVDEASPDKGKRIPIDIRASLKSRFLPDNTLLIRPHQGFVLRGGTTYAVVVMTSVRDTDGWPLKTHALLQEMAEGKSLSDPDKSAIQKQFAPLFGYLKEKNITIDQVAAATVFTTGDPVMEMKQLRTFIRTKIPTPAAPTKLECSENSDSTPYITCKGWFDSPHFQKGDAPFLGKDTGFFTYKADGTPEYTMKSLRFAVTIPKRYLASGATKQTPLPIVMYAHGTGGSYTTFIGNGTARTLANMGVAAFGIDQAVNGERTLIVGTTRLDFLFFNALNLPAARDNVRQSGADYYWQTRFIHGLKLPYKEHTIQFDPKRTWFMGHSQGGLTGPLVLAFEDRIQAAYLSAPGGLIVHTLLYKTKPSTPILLSAVLDYMLCEKQGDKPDVFHPILGLVQHFFDGADPVSYAPHILSGNRTPLNLLMTLGLTDGYAPTEVFEPLAIAMGLPLLGPEYKSVLGLDMRGIPKYSLPVENNFLHPSGVKTTVGFTQHKECKTSRGGTCDGHFVAFYNENAQRNWISFFQSMIYGESAQIH
jgi:predicted esterase